MRFAAPVNFGRLDWRASKLPVNRSARLAGTVGGEAQQNGVINSNDGQQASSSVNRPSTPDPEPASAVLISLRQCSQADPHSLNRTSSAATL
jgi:hypothetical protein